MAYVKHNWEEQEFITPDKLNHIEEGIITLDNDNTIIKTLDKIGITSQTYIPSNNLKKKTLLEDFKKYYYNSTNTYLSCETMKCLFESLIESPDLLGPDEIRIINLPNKLIYTIGETIDYSGLSVKAYKEGEVWNDPYYQYENDFIPIIRLDITPNSNVAALFDSKNITENQRITVSFKHPFLNVRLNTYFNIKVENYTPNSFSLTYSQSPNYYKYQDKQMIDFSDVTAYVKYNNLPWDVYGYENGIIPIEELYPNVKAIHEGHDKLKLKLMSVQWNNPINGQANAAAYRYYVEKEAPHHIGIIFSPQTDYQENDMINYSGFNVRLYDENNNVWSNETYISGIIPFNELVFSCLTQNLNEPLTSNANEGESEIKQINIKWNNFEGLENNPLMTSYNISVFNPYTPASITVNSVNAFNQIKEGNYILPIIINNISFKVYGSNNQLIDDDFHPDSSQLTFTYNNSTITSDTRATMNVNKFSDGENQDIEVEWVEPTSQNTLSTLFSIKVRKEIPSWSNATDSEIKQIITALDNSSLSYINVSWNIGDERKVQLKSMSRSYTREVHSSQEVSMVIIGYNDKYTLSNGNNSNFVIGFSTLAEPGEMINSTTTTYTWANSARRKWCNNTFRNALPNDIKSCFKLFDNYAVNNYTASSIIKNQDYFSLFKIRDFTPFTGSEECYDIYSKEFTTEEIIKLNLSRYNLDKKIFMDTSKEYWTMSPCSSKTYCSSISYSPTGAPIFSANKENENRYITVFGCI